MSDTRVGIYLRISDDPDGTQTATQRQREDCNRYAESRGWAVVDTFEDVDISAYQRKARRPEFERMLQAVRGHDVDGILSWKVDRISRRMRDFVRLDEECEEAGGFIASVVEGIDTRQSTGRFVAELLTAQARMESANTATRVARAHKQMAEAGRPSLGGSRLFGYTADRKHIIREEAALIHEAATRTLAGEPTKAICRDWQERGVKGSQGNAFQQTTLHRLLTNYSVAGLREFEGNLVKGAWPAILTEDEVRRLRTILRDPARRQNRSGTVRKHLLSGGLLRCGRCGAAMISGATRGVARYKCAKRPGYPGGCNGIVRKAADVEKMITEAVFKALEGVDITAFVKANAGAVEADILSDIRADEERLKQLAVDFYSTGAITREEFFTARDDIQHRLDRNRTRIGRSGESAALVKAIGAGARLAKEWESQDILWKRTVIAGVIDYATVKPTKHGKLFRKEDIEITWRL